MEQLATGLNKAAETMATAEAAPETPEAEDEGQEVPDVASLKDPELFQLLEEAYSYKRPRDRQGKSEIFRVSTNIIQYGLQYGLPRKIFSYVREKYFQYSYCSNQILLRDVIRDCTPR